MLPEGGGGGASPVSEEAAARRSKRQLRIKRFTMPSGGLGARISPCRQSSRAAVSPIGHGGNFEGHGRACKRCRWRRISKTAAIRWSTLRNGRATGCSASAIPFGGIMFEGLFQPMHLLVIFFIALLVFGPKKLPELGKGLGDGIRALKEGMKDNKEEAKAEVKPENKPENKA